MKDIDIDVRMKVILLVVSIWALCWLLRRSFAAATRPPSAPPPVTLQVMLACAYCGVHLPGEESLPGRGGAFCGEAHRAAFEKENAA